MDLVNFFNEKVDVERTVFQWKIPDFRTLFQDLYGKKTKSSRGRRNGKEKRTDSSNTAVVSDTFVRGQTVQRTSMWQLELRRNGTYICAGLSCLESFHTTHDEIWTRFDIDVVNFDGEVCHSQGANSQYCSDNVTKFIPFTKIKEKSEPCRCSFWETDIIVINDLLKQWDKLVPMNILNLQLRMYIYRGKPFDEASHVAEFQEPVKLCFTDHCQLDLRHPLLQAIKRMWTSNEEFDVIFNVDGEEIRAHKLLLSAQSSFFKSIFLNHKNDSHIEVKGISSEVFQYALSFMYTHDASKIKASNDVTHIVTILDACNRLDIQSLARICLVQMLNIMTFDNFTEIAFAVFSRVSQEQSFFKTEVKKYLME